MSKGRSHTYILNGEPQALVLRRSEDIYGWNNHKEKKLLVDITLEAQHQDKPLFSKPVHFEVTFYFPTATGPRAKAKVKHGDWYYRYPSLSLLINFLEHSMKGNVIEDLNLITSSNTRKVFAAIPRTEFTLTEL